MFFKCRAFIKRRKIHNNRYKETTLEASQIHLSLLIRSRGVAPSHSLHTNIMHRVARVLANTYAAMHARDLV